MDGTWSWKSLFYVRNSKNRINTECTNNDGISHISLKHIYQFYPPTVWEFHLYLIHFILLSLSSIIWMKYGLNKYVSRHHVTLYNRLNPHHFRHLFIYTFYFIYFAFFSNFLSHWFRVKLFHYVIESPRHFLLYGSLRIPQKVRVSIEVSKVFPLNWLYWLD